MACQMSYSKFDKACNVYTDIAKQHAPDWYLRDRKFQMCNVRYMDNGNGNCVVMGKVDSFLNRLDNEMDIYVQWWAANSPVNTCSYSGFCLPFPNETIAYNDTSNYGVTQVKDKKFTFSCDRPNSYYTRGGSKFVKPQIRFQFCDSRKRPMSKMYTLKMSDHNDVNKKQSSQEQEPQYVKLLRNALVRPARV